MYDELLFADTVNGFAATLVRRDDPGALLGVFLQRVSAVHALMGVAVTVGVDGVLQVPAIASSAAPFGQLQATLVGGPCAETLETGETVMYADLRREAQRWPEFADVALRAGVLAGASLPLRFDGCSVGVLSLYAGEVRSWTVADIDAARVLADMASVYLNNATGLPSHERLRPAGKFDHAGENQLRAGWSGRAAAGAESGPHGLRTAESPDAGVPGRDGDRISGGRWRRARDRR